MFCSFLIDLYNFHAEIIWKILDLQFYCSTKNGPECNCPIKCKRKILSCLENYSWQVPRIYQFPAFYLRQEWIWCGFYRTRFGFIWKHFGFVQVWKNQSIGKIGKIEEIGEKIQMQEEINAEIKILTFHFPNFAPAFCEFVI